MRVLLAGGGTGGHIYPAITIAKALQEKGAEILFVGTDRGLERDIVPREGFELRYIPVESFPRRISLDLLRAGITAMAGVRAAWRIVKQYKPHICIGTGGYVAGPVVLAAALQRIPTIIQEQNSVPGVTNRILERFVDKVALGFEAAQGAFKQKDKLVVTGNPVRREIVELNRSQGAKRLGLSPSQRHVLIFGASQGARSINRAVIEGFDKLAQLDAHYMFVTGIRGYDETLSSFNSYGRTSQTVAGQEGVRIGNLWITPYIYDMAAALATSDLVVGRAGASSLAEITARGLPAVLVPFPHASDNHQEKNARILEKVGAARVIADHELTGDLLAETIKSLIHDRALLSSMAMASKEQGRPEAVWDIVALAEGLVAARTARHS